MGWKYFIRGFQYLGFGILPALQTFEQHGNKQIIDFPPSGLGHFPTTNSENQFKAELLKEKHGNQTIFPAILAFRFKDQSVSSSVYWFNLISEYLPSLCFIALAKEHVVRQHMVVSLPTLLPLMHGEVFASSSWRHTAWRFASINHGTSWYRGCSIITWHDWHIPYEVPSYVHWQHPWTWFFHLI